GRRAPRHRRDGGVASRRGPAGARKRQAARLRAEHHRRLPRLGRFARRARDACPGREAAPLGAGIIGAMPQRPPQLGHLEYLGDATKFAGQIQALIPKCNLLARIIVEQPLLGAKILMELVLMLSQRLRATSERLLGVLDEHEAIAAVPDLL